MKKSRFIVIAILIILISIGFAIISTTLNVSGNTSISKNTWDIHFENIQITDGSVAASNPVIDENKTKVTYSVTLTYPGDYYEFTVDAKNDGTIDGMIDTISNTTLTIDQLKYLNYTVTYNDGQNINNDDLLKAKEKVTFKIRLEYKTDISASDLPENDIENLILTLEINYKQSNQVQSNDIIKMISGNMDTSGSEFAIGNEHFIVLKSVGNYIYALSKYPLKLDLLNIRQITELEVSDNDYYIEYSEENYILEDITYSNHFSNQLIVYEERCNAYPYIEKYKEKLNDLGLENYSIGLPDYEMILSAADCEEVWETEEDSGESFLMRYDCNPPSWLSMTSFWTANAINVSYAYDNGGIYAYEGNQMNFEWYDQTNPIRAYLIIQKS